MKKKLDDLFRKAKAAFKKEQYSAVVEIFKSYLKFRPHHAAAWFFYGASLQNIGLDLDAESALLKSLKLAPKEKRCFIYARLGRIYKNRGKFEKAESIFSRACRPFHRETAPTIRSRWYE